MKKKVVGWAIGALLVASCGRQADPRIEPSTSSSVPESRVSAYGLEEKCAKDAYGLYKREWEDATTTYTNHFNVKLEKCFFVTEMHLVSGKEIATHMMLMDVLEHREMGAFDQIKREAPPYTCEVSGTKCTSLAEWDALAKPYMED
jgi:hypothetical protein